MAKKRKASAETNSPATRADATIEVLGGADTPIPQSAYLDEAARAISSHDLQRAQVLYEQALSRWGIPEALKGLAHVAQLSEEWSRARGLWGDYVKECPDDIWGRYFLADMTARAGDPVAALEMLEDLRDSSERSTAISRAIQILLDMNDVQRAYPLFKELEADAELPENVMRNHAYTIIQKMLAQGDYPPRLFDLDPYLLDKVRYERLRK